MDLDLSKGVYLRIGGDIGKHNSIPIKTLVKIANNLQNLITTIADCDLPNNQPFNKDQFTIELFDFKHSSAVPGFIYSPRAEYNEDYLLKPQRELVNNKFKEILKISNNGNYDKLGELYPKFNNRRKIINNVYKFRSGFGADPVSFVDYSNDKMHTLYEVNEFNKDLKKKLLQAIPLLEPKTEISTGVARIKIIRSDKKEKFNILDRYEKSEINLNYAPEIIISDNIKYYLKYPLRCSLDTEDNFFVIKSEMLGIIGTGKTEVEAEQSFSDEFNYIYQRFNELDEIALTKNNAFIKIVINNIVEKVDNGRA